MGSESGVPVTPISNTDRQIVIKTKCCDLIGYLLHSSLISFFVSFYSFYRKVGLTNVFWMLHSHWATWPAPNIDDQHK